MTERTLAKREWFVIEDSRKNGVFAPDEARKIKGYIPRDVAESICGRDLSGTQYFTRQEGEWMREHPEWRNEL